VEKNGGRGKTTISTFPHEEKWRKRKTIILTVTRQEWKKDDNFNFAHMKKNGGRGTKQF
jgi:hypothetical protein